MKSPSKIGVVVLGCLVLGAVFFGFGYWQGQRAPRQETYTPATDPARVNPAHPPIPANATPEMKEFLENQSENGDRHEEALNFDHELPFFALCLPPFS